MIRVLVVVVVSAMIVIGVQYLFGIRVSSTIVNDAAANIINYAVFGLAGAAIGYVWDL
jgi:hypothetical protein